MYESTYDNYNSILLEKCIMHIIRTSVRTYVHAYCKTVMHMHMYIPQMLIYALMALHQYQKSKS